MSTSHQPAPPRPLAEVLSYRDDLTDALTGGPITGRTQLTALHQPDPSTSEGQLVRNLAGVARPAQPCYIVGRGARFPPAPPPKPTRENPPPSYGLTFTCNRLLTAPALRLECFIFKHQLTVAVDFHFMLGDGPGIKNFVTCRGVERYDGSLDEIRFDAAGATSEGLNKAHSLMHTFDDSTKRFINQLEAYTTKPSSLRLRFPRSLSDRGFALSSLLPYLPGGEMPLKTLTVPEWTALLPLGPDRSMETMLYHPEAPYPFVTLENFKLDAQDRESVDTFSTPTHASVELYESSRIMQIEQQSMLEEWAKTDHSGTLLQSSKGGPLVMAIWSSPTRTLSGNQGVSSSKCELPDRFQTQLSWEGANGNMLRGFARRTSEPLPGINADVLFVIPKYSDAMKEFAVAPKDIDRHKAFKVTFRPVIPQSPLRNKLDTAISVGLASKWHQLLLNQNHSSLPALDLALETTSVPPVEGTDGGEPSSECVNAAVEKAYHWMLNWRQWNAEQLQALKSIRKAVGGFVLITGPAGTGKTLVLQALCVFLWRLGFHLLMLCPSNSNCSDFVGKLKDYFGTDSKDGFVAATRVYSQSVDFSPDKASKEQCASKSSKRPPTGPDSIYDFEIVRTTLQDTDPKYADHSDYSLTAQVVKAAKEHTMEPLLEHIGKTKEPVDVWVVLDEYMTKAENKRFDWADAEAVRTYQMAYDRCKAQYVAQSRFIVTTTGNVRCPDITDNFARNKHGSVCKGIVVVLDEACKDQEIDTLSALLWPDWRDKITGMVMLGDDRQLEPTNTGSKGKLIFNSFNSRVSTPLLSRLKRQGFPCTELVEQHRMSHHISDWPFSQFYPPGMRNGKHTYRTLKEKLPGLDDCLEGILRSLANWAPVLDHPMLSAQDRDRILRTHYFEVDGRRDKSTRSPFVLEHAHFFFDQLYWPLNAYFGEKTHENVLIICAYKEQKHCYEDAARHLTRAHQIPDAHMPKIVTIDSSQGTEAPVTIIDCSIQQYNPKHIRSDIGFVDDDKRMNVALTRAQEVRWLLGGHCNVAKRKTGQPGTPAYVRYKEKVSWSGELTTVGQWPKGGASLTRDGGAWLEGIKRHYISRGATYTVDLKRTVRVM